jgi:hypothetical protein
MNSAEVSISASPDEKNAELIALKKVTVGLCVNEKCLAAHNKKLTGLGNLYVNVVLTDSEFGDRCNASAKRNTAHGQQRRLCCIYCGCNTQYQCILPIDKVIFEHFQREHPTYLGELHDTYPQESSKKRERDHQLKNAKELEEASTQITSLRASNEHLLRECQALQEVLENSCNIAGMSHDDLIDLCRAVGKRLQGGRDSMIKTWRNRGSGKFSAAEMCKYSNKDYVEAATTTVDLQDDLGAGKVEQNLKGLVVLLQEIMEKHTSDDDATTTATPTKELVDEECKIDECMNLAMALIIGIVLNSGDSRYSFPLGTLLCLQIRTLYKSRLSVDLVAHLVAGATDRGIRNSLKFYADEAEKYGLMIPARTSKVFCWDNLGTYVYAKQSRVVGQNAASIDITTTRIVYHVQRPGVDLIQKRIDCAPWNDKD